jgi:hypothetical protein
LAEYAIIGQMVSALKGSSGMVYLSGKNPVSGKIHRKLCEI